ncbi:MAG: tetratricopeptide repeat protein [Myxococcaceae bacterium]
MRWLVGPLSAALLLLPPPVKAATTLASPPLRPTDAPLAQFGPRSPEAEQAEELMSEGEFERAVRVLKRGVAASDVSDDTLVELYRLMGLAYLYLGDPERARDAYEKLLQARPDYELPKSAPPKIREVYARIKEDIRKRRVRPVTLTAEPVADTVAGQPLVVKAHIEDLALGSRARFYYRRAGAQAFSSVDFARVNGSRKDFEATLPAFELAAEARGYDIEYYLEVADAAQRRLAGKGDAFNPSHFTVLAPGGAPATEQDGTAWYQNPWVWIVGGAVAAGATAGIIAIANNPPTGTLPVTIRVNP